MFPFFVIFLLFITAARAQQIRASNVYQNNNEAAFPGHALDYNYRVRFNSSPESVLNSTYIANQLAERQRYLYEHSGRRAGGPGVANFNNNEATFPGLGFDYVGNERRHAPVVAQDFRRRRV